MFLSIGKCSSISSFMIFFRFANFDKFVIVFAGAEQKIILCNKIDDQKTTQTPIQIHFKYGKGRHADNIIFGKNNDDY